MSGDTPSVKNTTTNVKALDLNGVSILKKLLFALFADAMGRS